MLTKMSGSRIGVASKGGKKFDLLLVQSENSPDIVAVIDRAQSEDGPGGRLFKVTHTDAHHAEKVLTEAGYSLTLDPVPEPPKSDEVQQLEAALKDAVARVKELEKIVTDLRAELAAAREELKAAA